MKLVDCIASGISHAEDLEEFEGILETDAAGSIEEIEEVDDFIEEEKNMQEEITLA